MSNQDVKDDVLIDIIIELADIIQKITLSGLIRYFIKKKYDKVPKVFNSIWVVSWLLFIALCVFSFSPNKFLAFIIAYRLWEMTIVNIWLFLVYEKVWFEAKRLMILLIFQYLTLWLSFTFIYRTIFLNYPDSFIGIQSGGIWTWLYYSMTVLTTLGSNVMPCQNSIIAQSIVMIEVVLGILYVVWFLGATISQVRLIPKEG